MRGLIYNDSIKGFTSDNVVELKLNLKDQCLSLHLNKNKTAQAMYKSVRKDYPSMYRLAVFLWGKGTDDRHNLLEQGNNSSSLTLINFTVC